MFKKISIALAIALLAGVSTLYLVRERVVNYYYFTKINSVQQQYGIRIITDSIHLSSLSSAVLSYLYIIPTATDTLLSAANLGITVDIPTIIAAQQLSVKNIVLSQLAINLINNGTTTNYSFLSQHKNKDTSAVAKPYNAQLTSLVTQLFNVLPNNMQAQHLQVTYSSPTLKLGYTMDTLSIINGKLAGVLNEDFSGNTWGVAGTINKTNKHANLLLTSHANNTNVYAVERLTHVKCNFKQLNFAFNGMQQQSTTTTLAMQLSSKNLCLEHRRLSTAPIDVAQASINAQLTVGSNYIMLDSTSTALLNGLAMHPYARVALRPVKQYEVSINVPLTNANTFINALPKGMFSNFVGLQCSGKLGYVMRFKLNDALPDSCVFTSTMLDQEVKITKMGVTDFSMINGAFAHKIYEKDNFIRSIIIGTSNPNFYPIASISPYVQQAILTSEDGSFMWHKGFNEGAFRKSIAQNYKERRFARGGSTISMQLVKNVFLSRNKTVSRKAEEALIVWFIEHLHLSNKQRMYEVYLNSIEFGPNVYGIGEASQFYFAKKPNEITLNEGIFLSCIVPKPKAFMYYFDAQGKLNAYLEPHFQFIARILHYKGYITENELNDVRANVAITGVAKRYLKTTTDTLASPRTFEELWRTLDKK